MIFGSEKNNKKYTPSMDNGGLNEWTSRKNCFESYVHIDTSESLNKLKFKSIFLLTSFIIQFASTSNQD